MRFPLATNDLIAKSERDFLSSKGVSILVVATGGKLGCLFLCLWAGLFVSFCKSTFLIRFFIPSFRLSAIELFLLTKDCGSSKTYAIIVY